MLKNRGEEGGRSLRRSRTLLCLEGVYSPCLIRLSSLSDYVIREAKRPGEGSFQFPRCTIHGSGKERPGTFMNFSSPARRKLHKNS